MHYIKGFVRQAVGAIKAKIAFEGIAIVADRGEYYTINGIEIAKQDIELVHPVKASKITLDLSQYQIAISATPRRPVQRSAADEVVAKQLDKLRNAMREMRRARAVFEPADFQAKFDHKAEFFKAEYVIAERYNEISTLRSLSRDFVERTNSLILDVYETKTSAQLKRELVISFNKRI